MHPRSKVVRNAMGGRSGADHTIMPRRGLFSRKTILILAKRKQRRDSGRRWRSHSWNWPGVVKDGGLIERGKRQGVEGLEKGFCAVFFVKKRGRELRY